MGSSALFILAQTTAFSGGVGGLLAHVGWVSKGVLVLLALFSLVSWAIILNKGISLARMGNSNFQCTRCVVHEQSRGWNGSPRPGVHIVSGASNAGHRVPDLPIRPATDTMWKLGSKRNLDHQTVTDRVLLPVLRSKPLLLCQLIHSQS